MTRYQTAFYEPIVADWSNFGTWTERGARDATMRAHDVWTAIVNEFLPAFDRCLPASRSSTPSSPNAWRPAARRR